MSGIFQPDYADLYDLTYQDKDYESECNLIEQLLDEFANSQVKRILDLGCGTGNHDFVLVNRGYEVVGVDRSPSMIERAKAKVTNGRDPRFVHESIQTLDLNESFDAVVMMFNVIGYQITNEDVIGAFKSARRHLAHAGGIFIFDYWHGPGVLTQRPSVRVKESRSDKGLILRTSTGLLDPNQHICRVHSRTWDIGSIPPKVSDEEHAVRFFFPKELQLLLDIAGFSMLKQSSFPDIERDLTEQSWTAIGVAKAN